MPKQLVDDFEEPASSGNPLAAHFRIPGLHIRLPSQGRFMPPGSVELTATGEVPVLPMRAYDEVLMKSPDALLSGYAIEKLIESCVPAVKNVKMLSAPDLDVLLLAIRSATFGNEMPIEATCPKCQTQNEFVMDIGAILDNVRELDASNVIDLSPEVTVHLRPYNVDNATRASLSAFNEAKKIRALETASDDERQAAINESIDRLNKVNIMLTGDCVIRVISLQIEVVNHAHIAEFVQQIPANWFKKIENQLKELNRQGLDRHQSVRCIKCDHEWSTEVEFDPASFFETGS